MQYRISFISAVFAATALGAAIPGDEECQECEKGSGGPSWGSGGGWGQGGGSGDGSGGSWGSGGGNGGGHGGGDGGGQGTYRCPSSDTQPLCCSVDVLGVADLDCGPPRSTPSSLSDFQSICGQNGQTAECCVLPVLGQALLCNGVS